ncbi:MAG: 16S rRNA (uracil(1498)-N(3))-methyltransferase [Clostridiales bacterium]|nr:16S rRNA (uracil(1498)-N(3))-methyltransferase [Clostridiales bacterium]
MDNRYYFKEKNDNIVIFSSSEAQHLARVRRAKIGDEIVGFNGDGIDYNLKIIEITKDKVKAEILSSTKNKAYEDTGVTVYLSFLKNDALTTLIDHLAELNVKTVKLFKSDFSVANLDEKKIEKLNQISIQASKQCERADIMKIELIAKSQIEKDLEGKLCFFAYENADEKITSFSGDFAVIIGPEGGFSPDEVQLFSKFCKTISLGKTILRAEVAGVVAVSSLKAVQHES